MESCYYRHYQNCRPASGLGRCPLCYWRWHGFPGCACLHGLRQVFLWALLLAPLPNQLPAPLEGVDLQVEGWIASIPDHEWRSTRFEFAVDRAIRGNQPIPLADKRLRLSWWDDSKADKETAIPPKLRVGDRWNFTVRLKRRTACSIPAVSIMNAGCTPRASSPSARSALNRRRAYWPPPTAIHWIAIASASRNPSSGCCPAIPTPAF
ncbi:MAG: DUF4131 domain-containing protein [Synechococcaceae cyanobacterium SM1_2_3]|nr:DUF4131 domain-containing protein [Synechococcaceae cyanobacterium SM1_2_3]